MGTQITDLPQAQTPLGAGDIVLVIQGGIAKQTAQSNLQADAVQANWTQNSPSAPDYIQNKPILGTAAYLTAGTLSGDVLLLAADNKLPALDGSLLTNVAAGTVTTISVNSANGFNGNVTNPTTTPVINLTTTVSGIVKGSASALVAATAGTDYSVGTSGLATGILKSTTSTGVLSIAVAGDFPTLNQNTTGNAATATALQTPRTINGSTFDGTYNITVTAAAGTLTGTTLASGVVTSSLTTVGTIGTGTWQGTTVGIGYGGTGQTTANAALNALLPSQTGNNGKTLQTDGTNTSWSNAGSGSVTSITVTGANGIGISGSPITTSGTIALSLGTITGATWHGGVVGSTYGGTGVNNGSSTITIGGNLTLSGAYTTTATVTANSSFTLPTSGIITKTDTTGISGAVAIQNIVACTQAVYNAIGSPDPNTLYIING